MIRGRWGQARQWVGRTQLRTVVAVVALAVLGAGLAMWGLVVFTEGGGTLDRVKVALTIPAGIGAAVALAVAYRRQGVLERKEESEARQEARELQRDLEASYITAAAQLGDPDATVRLAGVYALANLADAWPDHRQQCVDVLCARLRLPWDPNLDVTYPHADRDVQETQGGESPRTVTYRLPSQAGETEVRRTILRVIANHLRPVGQASDGTDQVGPWSHFDYNLRAATLPDLDWSDAVIRGELDCTGASFAGYAGFGGANFFGDARFDQASFAGSVNGTILQYLTPEQTANLRSDEDAEEATLAR